jgi:hypothetical protein
VDKDDTQVLSDIANYGWHVVLIEEDEEGPSFGYSVGLFHTYQHPEVVVFGLKVDLLHQIINALGREVAGGKQYRPGEESGNAIEGYSCAFLSVAPEWYSEYLGYALWFYKGDGFPALECVWPDKQQKYPWQQGFSEALRPKQPILVSDGEAERLKARPPAV